MLYFAYGANMHLAVMRKHAPEAKPIGIAEFANHRFVITADGYASVAPLRAHTVYGVLWQVAPRDRVMLDAWEGIARNLYRVKLVPVRQAGRCRMAFIYVARLRPPGLPKAAYMELVIEAARKWDFPDHYLRVLERWLPPRSIRGTTGRRARRFAAHLLSSDLGVNLAQLTNKGNQSNQQAGMTNQQTGTSGSNSQ